MNREPLEAPAEHGSPTGQGHEGTQETPCAEISKPLLSSIEKPTDSVIWPFLGPHGLRAGWSILLFAGLVYLFALLFGTAASILLEDLLHLKFGAGTAPATIAGEGQMVLALISAAAIIALVEHRHITDYNLAGARRVSSFACGLASGFMALSVLVGAMALGGWLHLASTSLSGVQICRHGAAWALAFLLVGFTEEGCFRCYLQYTFTRGINFWWALLVVGSMCLFLIFTAKGQGAWGVYFFAGGGVLPCLYLHWKKSERSAFWQAAWTGSTGFGFIHTFNNGENWIGIFAAATIGFVFCVSVRVAGSAWWAIGCHSAWDWAETYFYGTADSGLVPRGHLLTATPTGPALWSGGADGPEGSLLVLPIIGLLMLAVILQYGHGRNAVLTTETAEHQLG